MTAFSRLFFNLLAVAAILFFTTRAAAQMSEPEKKSAARAAYLEGTKLQDEGKFEEALKRFDSAQKLFDAPTHVLRIAECQALTGRLVEASETYELLARKMLPPGSPEAFTQAQQQGQAELPGVRARIPSLRVTTKPGAQQLKNLVVNINGVTMLNDVLGLARPLNPGLYRISAQATGWATPQSVDIPLAEKEQKSVELTLVEGATATAVVAPPPPAFDPYEGTKPKPTHGPTSTGLLFGLRGGAVLPAGSLINGVQMADVSKGGAGGGIDIYGRVAKIFLLGLTVEAASLGAPSTTKNATGTFDATLTTTYFGVNVGVLPNVDAVSFIGDIGFGSRSFSSTLKSGSVVTRESSANGLEFALGAGLSIPAGPVRIVPRVNFGVGSFATGTSPNPTTPPTAEGDIPEKDRATHTFVFLGLALYYSLDFGSKPAPL